jgi:hypothetical protein
MYTQIHIKKCKKALSFGLVLCVVLSLAFSGTFSLNPFNSQKEFGYSPVQSADAAWYDTDYSYCRPLTINSGPVATTTTGGFALYFSTTTASLKATSSAGKIEKLNAARTLPIDILFTSGTNCNSNPGTLLDYYHESYASTTGELHSWIEVMDLSSTTDKTILMYYGNRTASDLSDETGTFGALGEIAVYDLREDPSTAGASGITNSVSASLNNGTATSGMQASDSVIGKVGKAINFDGTNDLISFGSHSSLNIANGTALFWFSVDTFNTERTIWAKHDNSTGEGNIYVQTRATTDATNYQRLRLLSHGAASAIYADDARVATSTWTHGAVTFSTTSVTQQIYLSGVLDNSRAVDDALTDTDGNLLLGARAASPFTNYIDGKIDDFRLYNRVLTSADIATIYANTNDVNTFWSEGSEENAPTIMTLSGTLYSNEGTTPITSGKTIKLAVTSTTTPNVLSTTTDSGAGTFHFSVPVTMINDATAIVMWVDGDAGTRAATVSVHGAYAGDVSGFNLYKDHVIARNDHATEYLQINEFASYDSSDDADIQFTASTTTGTLSIGAGQELYLRSGDAFTVASSETVTLNGSYENNSGTLSNTGTIDFAGSSQSIAGTLTGTGGALGDIKVSGSYTFSANASTSDLFITSTGSVTAPSKLTVSNFRQYGSFNAGSGTLYFDGLTTSESQNMLQYLVGRDVNGSSGGAGGVTVLDLATSTDGNYLYVAKAGASSGCTSSSGSAAGCELLVFSITSSTTMSFSSARSADGGTSGTANTSMRALAVRGNYLYVGKGSDGTACSQSVGSALGCELMVFNISTPSSPAYVAGRDASGTATGTASSVNVNDMSIVGNYLYMVRQQNATACSQTAGSAIGCELVVFDISSSTNPIYVAGRDVDGSTNGTSLLSMLTVHPAGSMLYVGKSGNTTACSQTAGSAIGCELMVFDISSPSNPVYVAGRDVSGSATGADAVDHNTLQKVGNYLYVGRGGDDATCSQSAGFASGCELAIYSLASTTNPVYVGGVDVSGVADGLSAAGGIASLATYRGHLYVGRAGNSVNCQQVPSINYGCELAVFDLASSTSPVFVYGLNAGGLNTGTAASTFNTLLVLNDELFAGSNSHTNACSQTAGSAVGCEITKFAFTSGANIDGSLTGKLTGSNALAAVVTHDNSVFRANASTSNLTIESSATTTAPQYLSVSGAYTNSGIFISKPHYTMRFTGAGQTLLGTMTGSSALPNVIFSGSGTKTFSSTASTTNFTVDSGVTVSAPTKLTIAGDMTNAGSFTHNSGEVVLDPHIKDILFGLDESATKTGTSQLVDVGAIHKVGNYLYVTRSGNSTACSQTAGSATGCELIVLNVSSSTNPVYVAGRDANGSATGGTSVAMLTVTSIGNYLFVGKAGSSAATCSQTAGTTGASACELMVFDISSSSNPVYVAGRDANGASGGNTNVSIFTLIASGNYLYVGKGGNSSSACSQTAGSAIGCELMVFNVSTPTSPTYVAGRDADGSNSGSTSLTINNLFVSSSALYLVRNGNVTACSQTAGSAIGCELMVFNIASTTNPVYAAGRDVSGSAGGIGNLAMYTAAGSANALYIGNIGSTTACSQTAGSAAGCELMVFNIASTTNPVFVAGRDVSGSNTGTSGTDTNMIVTIGNSLYMLNTVDGDRCTSNVGGASGCELKHFDISSTTNPIYTFGIDRSGTSDGTFAGAGFSDMLAADGMLFVGSGVSGAPCDQRIGYLAGCELVAFDISGTVSGSFGSGSSFYDVNMKRQVDVVSDVTIADDVTVWGILDLGTSALTLKGDYTNYGSLTASTSEVIFGGTSQQTATGTMTGTSAFNDVTITNTSGSGASSQSVLFGRALTAADTFKMNASTSARFLAGATTTAQNLDLQGTAVSSVWLRSSTNGSEWFLDADGTKTVRRVNVRDSDASASSGGITDMNGTDATNNTNWTFTSATIGTSTLANHVSGQTTNAFSSADVTNGILFSFKLTPNGEQATTTQTVLTLFGVKKIGAGNFSNIRLLRDVDNDGAYDASDISIGGSGVMSISGQAGTITFTTDWLSTTTRNYIVVANWTAPQNGSFLGITLPTTGIESVGVTSLESNTIYGSVDLIQHNRNNKGGGGGGGSTIGGEAPAGGGVQGGGGSGGGGSVDTNTGGGLIGNETGFYYPSAESGSWTNGANAYDGTDGTYATTNAANTHSYSNHSFGVPGNNQITGIATKLEVSGTTAAGTIDVQLSWDGGTSWTSVKSTPILTTTDTVQTLGSASDLWGRTWTTNEFSNGNFRIRLTGAPSSNTLQVDAIQVRVYHQSTGGGGGGGGEI